MILQIFLFIIGIVLLIKGADWLVSGSSSIARKYGVSELVIGLTVVGFGTSMPEFIVNVIASINGGTGEIVMGNIIGSNNFNLFVTLGIVGLITPLAVQGRTVRQEIPISLIAIVLLLILANDTLLWQGHNNVIGRTDGILLLVLFGAFMVYIFRSIKTDRDLNGETVAPISTGQVIFLVIIGFTGLIIGGKLMVDNAIKIAETLNVSQQIIGLTIVAAGTSLPELATSIIAALRGKKDLAVGNIIGSNIFNILFILGTSVLIRPVDYDLAFNLDGLMLVFGTIFLLVAMFTGKKGKVDRWEAAVFLIAYIIYLIYLINKEI
jgi:cation:H+ antiporter